MADSMITKRAFAAALKELAGELPYSKITVGKICDRCEMNRTSFYYHFRDKYDLVNWIFDTEFVKKYVETDYTNAWDSVHDTVQYFYDNREFYSKVLEFNGQNSFADHFRSLLHPLIQDDIQGILGDDKNIDFQADFFTNAFISALENWIKDKNCPPPDECVDLLKSCLNVTLDRGSVLKEQANSGKQ